MTRPPSVVKTLIFTDDRLQDIDPELGLVKNLVVPVANLIGAIWECYRDLVRLENGVIVITAGHHPVTLVAIEKVRPGTEIGCRIGAAKQVAHKRRRDVVMRRSAFDGLRGPGPARK